MSLESNVDNLEIRNADKITFVGTSNTVVDTTTGSFGVGVDANGPTSNLHVVGDALITGNVAVDTDTLFVDSVNDRVGVGTTDPDVKFQVEGTSSSHQQLTKLATWNIFHHRDDGSFEHLITYSGSDGQAYFDNRDNFMYVQIPAFSGETLYTSTVSGYNSGYFNAQFRDLNGNKPNLNQNTTYQVHAYSSRISAFGTITTSGNVGIGKTDPAIQLDVHGTDAKIGRALNSANIHASEKRDSVYIGRWDDTVLSTSFLGMRCRVDTHTALGYGSYSSQTEIGFYTWGNSIASSRQVFAINASGNGNMIGILTQSSSGTTSDDRIKYNEEDIKSPLTLISQLNPQKYEKIVSVAVSEKEGIWIPTDEEWESVKSEYTYVDEFGFIAQDVRAVPELSFLVNGEETRTDTNTSTPEEYSNLTSEEQATYTPSYVYESNTITQQEYSNLTHEEQGVYTTQYTKQIETQTPLSLNYNGLFVLAIGAIKELKAENDAIKARLDALENA